MTAGSEKAWSDDEVEGSSDGYDDSAIYDRLTGMDDESMLRYVADIDKPAG